eukprot:1381003-Rhodomonas_salina.1
MAPPSSPSSPPSPSAPSSPPSPSSSASSDFEEPIPYTTARCASSSSDEDELIQKMANVSVHWKKTMTNAEREKNGLPPLQHKQIAKHQQTPQLQPPRIGLGRGKGMMMRARAKGGKIHTLSDAEITETRLRTEREDEEQRRYYTHITNKYGTTFSLQMPYIYHSKTLDMFVNNQAVTLLIPTNRTEESMDNGGADYVIAKKLDESVTHGMRIDHENHKSFRTQLIDHFQRLTPLEIITILTYTYRGDKIVNDYLEKRNGEINILKKIKSHKDGSTQWTYNHFKPDGTPKDDNYFVLDNLYNSKRDYVIFQKQVVEYLMKTDETIQEQQLQDAKFLNRRMKKFDHQDWAYILYEYTCDLIEILISAPQLQHDLCLYRGETVKDPSKGLLKNSKMRFTSYTPDPSIASWFARGMSGPDNGPITIYRIQFPKGTPLLFTGGLNYTTDAVESEFIVPPHFHMDVQTQTKMHTTEHQYGSRYNRETLFVDVKAGRRQHGFPLPEQPNISRIQFQIEPPFPRPMFDRLFPLYKQAGPESIYSPQSDTIAQEFPDDDDIDDQQAGSSSPKIDDDDIDDQQAGSSSPKIDEDDIVTEMNKYSQSKQRHDQH